MIGEIELGLLLARGVVGVIAVVGFDSDYAFVARLEIQLTVVIAGEMNVVSQVFRSDTLPAFP